MSIRQNKRTWNDPQEILDILFSSRIEELENEEFENLLENDEDDDEMIDDDVVENDINMDSDEYDDDEDNDYVAVQNKGEGDNLKLDTHPSRSSPPPELSPSSIISCTEETYEGHQDALPLPPQSSITAEISKKSQSDQEAHVSGLDIGPPQSLFVPIIPMTTIEIGDTSEEYIDFSAAGTSGASSSCAGFSGTVNCGVRKHSLDPVVDDIESTSEET